MNETKNNHTTAKDAGLPEREQAILDTALLESDQLLARSLHDDQRRRRRRYWLLASVFGGVVMSVLILAFLLGWFTLTVPVSGETEKAASKPVAAKVTEKPRKAVAVEPKEETEKESFEFPGFTDKDWRKRLLAVKQSDRWSVGAEIGMDLVRIPGDRPYEILSANWKKIASSARKQILKGFTPGMMGNKEIHERFFDVMHLGMMDTNPGVRSYAATYIEMQGLPDFEHDAKGYKKWRKETQGISAKKVAKIEKSNAKPEVSQIQRVLGSADKQWQTRLLALKEGGNWSEGANIGMELVRISGDRPYKILKASWPKIATSARKQILKGFTPGMMGNEGIHAKFFDVMHLGMTDPDAEVHSFAAAYIEMQGLPNFEKNLKGYAAWRDGAIKGLSSEEIIDNEDAALHGWSMFFSGRKKVAERFFRKALKEDPDNLSATNGLGFILLNQGDHEQAKPMFEKVLETHKDAGGPMNGLAHCLKAEGKVDEAIVLWEQVVNQYPGALDAIAGLAETCLERKEFAKSAKYFKTLLKADPKNEAIQEGLLEAVDGLTSGE